MQDSLQQAANSRGIMSHGLLHVEVIAHEKDCGCSNLRKSACEEALDIGIDQQVIIEPMFPP